MPTLEDHRKTNPGTREYRYRGVTALLLVLGLAASKSDFASRASGEAPEFRLFFESAQPVAAVETIAFAAAPAAYAGVGTVVTVRPADPGPRSADAWRDRVFLDTKSGAMRGATVSDGVLSASEVRQYRSIFHLQERGRWSEADQLIGALEDRSLLGYVWQQRLLHPSAYRASFRELSDWLARYPDHLGADRILSLAQRRRPDDQASLPRVQMPARLPNRHLETIAVRANVAEPDTLKKSVPGPARRSVEQLLTAGRPRAALALLGKSEFSGKLDPVAYDSLRTRIAAYTYFDGSVSTALNLAEASANRSGTHLPYAHWIAGLAAYRTKDYARAARHFSAVGSNHRQSPWQLAAGAYWAARSLGKIHRASDEEAWTLSAARFPRTFYGLLAAYTVGRGDHLGHDLRFDNRRLTRDRLAALASVPAGRRAIQLTQVGRLDLAEWELGSINPENNETLGEAQIAFAEEAGLAGFALYVANAVGRPAGGTYDNGLYPLPNWQPHGGFDLDRALVFAFVRQESRFNPGAVSHRGAAGLMQLMPNTARHVLSSADLPFGTADRGALFDPEINMALGQAYIQSLLDRPEIAGNLFYVALAYNAGPANLGRWTRSLDLQDDPLLFIESIPFGQTRVFVEKIMTNYWIYRLRLDQDVPTLAAVAAGAWPIYTPLDDGPEQVAFNEPYR